MLSLEDISTYYGSVQALKGVSMTVQAGEIVCLIGANGAGKSTLLNTVSGITPARSGRVLLDSREIQSLAAERIVRLGVSQSPERRQIFGRLTVRDNLQLGAYLRLRRGERRQVAADMERIFALFPILQQRRTQLAGTLSGGEQQMLAIGRSLMARPRVLLLDEPSLGLAPLLIREIFLTIQKLRDDGVTILLVEQNARAALTIADRGYVLETGRIVLGAPAAALLQNQAVQQAYLGAGPA